MIKNQHLYYFLLVYKTLWSKMTINLQTVLYKNLSSKVWYQTRLNETILPYIFDEINNKDKPLVYYISINEPIPFNLDKWEQNYVVLFLRHIHDNPSNEKLYHLYLSKQNYNTIIKDGLEVAGNGQEGIMLLKEFCKRANIQQIYIEDEAIIFTQEGTILLSDREDILYGTFSWYLRYFELVDEKFKKCLEKRKQQIITLLLEKHIDNITDRIKYLKENFVDFPLREFQVKTY
jgi:hypothetical protein